MEITPQEAIKLIEEGAKIVDVREVIEFEQGHLPNAINFPISIFNEKIKEQVNTEDKIIVICLHGMRSLDCMHRMMQMDYKKVYSVKGGLAELNNFLGEKINV